MFKPLHTKSNGFFPISFVPSTTATQVMRNPSWEPTKTGVSAFPVLPLVSMSVNMDKDNEL